MKNILFLSAAFLIAGCASTGTYQELSIMTSKISNYRSVAVRTSSRLPDSQEATSQLQTQIISKLLQKKGFAIVVDGDAVNNGAELQINTEIISLRKVQQGERLLLGALAGQASIEAEITLKEVKTGKNIGVFKAEGKSSGGTIFAGTTDQALERAAEKIAEYIRTSR